MSRSSLPQDFRNFDFLMPWEGAGISLARRREGHGGGAGRTVARARAQRAVEREAEDPAETAKTTDTPAQTGGGAPADKQATKDARKPRSAKAKSEVSKPSRSKKP